MATPRQGTNTFDEKDPLWYKSHLVFKPDEYVDLNLLDDKRSVVHTGTLLRSPGTVFDRSWSEVFALLFDNYLVLTKSEETDGLTKYHVIQRPIPLELLTLGSFSDSPKQRSADMLCGLLGGASDATDDKADSREVFPFVFSYIGRLGSVYTLYNESEPARAEWKQKLESAVAQRKRAHQTDDIVEFKTLSADTFLATGAPIVTVVPAAGDDDLSALTTAAKVNCSVPFKSADGRALVAFGCDDGIWIGVRHDSKTVRHVLHLKDVTQCAMLEEFGMFLVLSSKSLFAYSIESLILPAEKSSNAPLPPQKLSGSKDVQFFTVGKLQERTMVIYMKKKGLASVFKALEPILGRVQESARAKTTSVWRSGLRPQNEWFRTFREFFLPSEAYGLTFLKSKIAIHTSKGFEFTDLIDFNSITLPSGDDSHAETLAKRSRSCKPIETFAGGKDEFLLCYDEIGLYVDRHGDPLRMVEWEGTVHSAAVHEPFLFLFDAHFIEVRDLETGCLVNIIPGADVRCTWAGRGPAAVPETLEADSKGDRTVDREPRVHVVITPTPETLPPSSDVRAALGAGMVQHVFELIPGPTYLTDFARRLPSETPLVQ